MTIKSVLSYFKNLRTINPSKFSKEITVIIVIKLALIYTLWSLCFSHPLPKATRPQAISEQVYGVPLHNENNEATLHD